MKDLAEILEQVQAQLAALSERVEQLEAAGAETARSRRTAPVPAAPKPAPQPAPAKPEITEEELIAISAALAAYLGVRVRIQTDSIAQLACVGTAGACVDSGVPHTCIIRRRRETEYYD